ncbi:ParB N-terminal domain-containing protein [bacterium]|nr:ParB N-terminal domain-containing protein [bacterium]
MREIKEIPLDSIKILNSRERDPRKFEENVESIRRVGLKRPIVVNTRYLEETGMYELVCGQGRIEAFKKLELNKIPALFVDVDRPITYIMSIAENAARQTPQPLWFAGVIKGLKDNGMSVSEIAEVTGRSGESIRNYINLITRGEEELIKAIERGQIGVSTAMQIVKTPEPELQNLLVEGLEAGLVSGTDIPTVRRLIVSRQRYGKKYPPWNSKEKGSTKPRTLDELRKDIKQTLSKQEKFIQKSKHAENRLIILSDDLYRLNNDTAWIELIREENLIDFPHLKGDTLKGIFDSFNIGGKNE